jgi:hypothetical protein
MKIIAAVDALPNEQKACERQIYAASIKLQPAWLSHFAKGLKIPRRKSCRFDSGPGHQPYQPLIRHRSFKLILAHAALKASASNAG